MIRWLWSKLVVWGLDFSYDAVDPNERGMHPISIDDCGPGIDLDDPIRFSVQAVQAITWYIWKYTSDPYVPSRRFNLLPK